MKLKRWLLLAASLLIALVGVSLMNGQTTSASTMKDGFYTQFPKHMRGNWYNYYKSSGATLFSHYRITKHHMIIKFIDSKNHAESFNANARMISNNTVKKYYNNKKFENKYQRLNLDWFTAFPERLHHLNWMSLQYLYADTATEDYLNIAKHGKYWVLSEASGAGVAETNHFYHSKKVAKKLIHKHYKHFLYY